MSSKELAGKRNLDQMKRGYFYIYTSRNAAKAMVMKRAYTMMIDEEPLESTRDLGMYYIKKYADDPDFMAYVVSRV